MYINVDSGVEKKGRKRFAVRRKLSELTFLIFIMIVVFVFSSLVSPYFLSKENIIDVITTNVPLVILSIGMFFTILTGGIDLSVGSAVAVSGCFLAGFLEVGHPWYTSLAYSILLTMLGGAVNGIVVAYGKVPPFIATLGMMSILRGLAYIYRVGSPKPIFDDVVISVGEKSIFGGWLTLPILVVIICGGICWFVLERLPFGRRLYAIGDNQEAAHLTGIHVSKYLFVVYLISSGFAALSGVILASRMMLGSALVGSGYELDAIAAAVLGGASLMGGRGSVVGTIVGAYVFGFIANSLNLIGIGGYPQMIIKGLIIVVALLIVQRGDQK